MKNIVFAISILVLLSTCDKSHELRLAIQDEYNLLQNEVNLIDTFVLTRNYKIQIVKPDPSIDYKILVVKPDISIDYKMIIVDPENKNPIQMSEELEKVLNETLDKVKY